MSVTISYTADTDAKRLTAIGRPYLFFNEPTTMRITFQDEDGAAVDLSGLSLHLGAKDPANMDVDAFLFQSTDVTTDSGFTDLANGLAGFTVDLNTTQLDTYLATKAERKIRLIVKDTTGAEILTWDTSLSVRHPGITGDEDSPISCVLTHNLTATTAPGASNDSSEGYGVGSHWFDITADQAYACLDATVDAAVWDLISPPALVSQATAEAGTATDIESWSALRVAQSAAANAPSAAVSSVFGRTGAVTATSGDYNADQISETETKKILTSTERSKLSGIVVGQANIAAVEINWDAGIFQYKTTSADDTYTFANAGDGKQVTVFITASGAARTPTFPASIVWAGDAVPGAITQDKVLSVTFVQVNSVVYASALEDMGVPA